MTRPTVLVHDMATNQTNERQMNDEEFAQYSQLLADKAAEAQAAAEAAAAKAALLARLGITEDEARLLLS